MSDIFRITVYLKGLCKDMYSSPGRSNAMQLNHLEKCTTEVI